jgi:hypothetical protein
MKSCLDQCPEASALLPGSLPLPAHLLRMPPAHARRYLSADELPDEAAPLGAPYVVGWGYLLSRDAAQLVLGRAAQYSRCAACPAAARAGGGAGDAERCASCAGVAVPAWWGRLPWEDVMVGALLRGEVEAVDHPGFLAPHMSCPPDAVVSTTLSLLAPPPCLRRRACSARTERLQAPADAHHRPLSLPTACRPSTWTGRRPPCSTGCTSRSWPGAGAGAAPACAAVWRASSPTT